MLSVMTVMIMACARHRPKWGNIRAKLTVLATCMCVWSDMALSMSQKSPPSPGHLFRFIVWHFLHFPTGHIHFLKIKIVFSPHILFLLYFCKCFPPCPEYLLFSWQVDSYSFLKFCSNLTLPVKLGSCGLWHTEAGGSACLSGDRHLLEGRACVYPSHLYTQSGT